MAELSRREEYAANEILRDHVYKRYENRAFPQEWRNLPELPSKSEICPPNQQSKVMADTNQEGNLKMSQMIPVYDQNLPHNIVDGPWPSREAYVGAHYQILREDSIAPLRRAVLEFKKFPALADDLDTCVYKDVRTLAVAKWFLLTRTGND
jgi:helicase required for RNAi-mediated heterochromatin assembly 1